MKCVFFPPQSAQNGETLLVFAEDARTDVVTQDDDSEATNRKQNKRSPRRWRADNTQRGLQVLYSIKGGLLFFHPPPPRRREDYSF